MNYSDIKDFNERCNSHPDHQKGIVTERMLSDRLHEEILELRMYIELEWSNNTPSNDVSCIECVAPDRAELEKAVEEAWRAFDIADAALMAYYRENT